MKKCFIIAIIVALNFNMLPCNAIDDFPTVFDDFPTTAKEFRAVVSLKNLGVIDGKSDRTFEPNSLLTREEFAKIISLAAKIEDITVAATIEDFDISEYQNRFYDVPQNDWYSIYVEAANESGLLLGISENEFGVGSNITKQDAMTVLYRLLTNKIKLQDDLQAKLPVDADLAEYAKEAVGSLAAIGVIVYDEQKLFHPCEYITRAGLCKAIYDTLTYAYSMKTFGVSGHRIWESYPNDKPTDDKLSKYKPEPFDIDKKENVVVSVEGFEGLENSFKTLITKGVISEEQAYSGKHSLKLSVPEIGTQIIGGKIQFHTQPSDTGAFFSATCMVKCEDMNKRVGYAVDIYGGGKYVKGIYEANTAATGTTDWILIKQVFQLPEGAEYFEMQMYFDATTKGTAYFDDITLKRVVMDPMETILVSPIYKGFIYGDGDINYDVTIDKQGGFFDQAKMKLRSQLVDEKDNVFREKEIDWCTEKQNITFSTTGIPEGDYYLETILTDKESKKEIQRDYSVIRKRSEDYRPAFYVDEYGRTIKDGKPYFMRAFYDLWGDELTETHMELMMDYLKGSNINFNAINPYDYYYRYNEPLYYFKPFKELEDRGISISTGFHGFSLGGLVRDSMFENARNVYANMVYQMKHYPSIFGYYSFDEQDFITLEPEFKWKYNIISDADPEKPIMGAHFKLDYRYGTYTNVTDILMEDVYPVYGLETDDIAAKGRAVSALRDKFPNRPIYSVIQAFKGGMQVSKGIREPNEDELRNMTWQAICEGAQGITFWASFYVYTKGLKPSLGWQEYMGIQNEIMGEVKQIESVLTSSETKPYYELLGAKDCFNATSKHYDGKSYVFMVNNTNGTQSGVLKLDDNVKNITSLYTGKTYNVSKDGYFKINFDSLAVDIFEYAQESYQSSEADLKLLKLFLPNDESIVINYNEEEEAAVRLPLNTETLKYSATVGMKANIYINGILSETSGSIAVNGKESINVKIVSENGKYTTAKEYKLLFEEGAE